MNISIIIPAYNCSKNLPTMIDSIDRSGLRPFEIIVVDDGSKDDTVSVLANMASQYPGLRIVRQENRGVSAARNHGLSEAKGDYVLFVDADDSFEPDSLSDAIGILESEKPDMLLFGSSFDYYCGGSMYRRDVVGCDKSGSMDPKTIGEKFEELFKSNLLSPVWNKLIRRELILSDGISFREDMIEMEDYIFSVHCLSRCTKICLLNRSVYHYRQAEDERGTFNRLWRINSLSEYMKPFYEASNWFGPNFDAQESVHKVADEIYNMLFHEQLRFASCAQICAAAEDMLSGEHSEVIADKDPWLYGKLLKRQYPVAWCDRKLKRIKHKAAVKAKCFLMKRRRI